MEWESLFSSIPQRGICQGEPLSPYIFVLCTGKLSHPISQEVEIGNWKPLQAGRNGPHVLYFMFADDLLLFGKATIAQINCMSNTLDSFCDMYGQQVAIEKTSILFSEKVPHAMWRNIAMVSGFHEYLGIPLIGKTPRRAEFDYLVMMVKDKLSSWKANHLFLLVV